MTLRRPLGLRGRLLLMSALISVITAAAVAGTGYVRSRDAIVQRAQDNAVVETTERIRRLYPLPGRPPDVAELERIAAFVAGREDAGLAESRGLTGGGLAGTPPSAELRATVAEGRVAWQRVDHAGTPVLVIGSQLRLTAGDTDLPSGIEVYVRRPLTAEADVVGALARDAWLTGAAGLLLALLLALFAARGVLRPVHQLRAAAARLGAGDLETRLEVRGGDELADVARTFNATAELLRLHIGELRRMEGDARRFVADVSHELRTPLAAMTAVSDLLDAEAADLPEVAGDAVRLVNREVGSLARLVNDLIEITRFDSGTAALALDEVDVAEALRATLRVRGYTGVAVALPDGIRARLDPRRLDVVVANLVENAVRHGAPPVKLSLTAARDEIVVAVSDRGPGLDPAVLPRVFARFYKVDTARARSAGSGLGLAIAWENARLHGGTLTAANRDGGGAVFTLRLPAREEDTW